MTEPTPPPRRPLATFLRASTEDTPAVDDAHALPASETAARPDDAGDALADVRVTEPDAATEAADAAVTGDAHVEVDDAPAPVDAVDRDRDTPTTADEPAATPAPSFLRLPGARLHTPRWQWGLVGGLVVLLSLQIAVADRARLAADAGSRPWIAGLCGVLRCSLPAWQEPTAFSMISRDVRPVPGQPGALQVQASFRNDARWAQSWPSLRLSLSDADGRVIGTNVFAPRDYLDPAADAAALLEPGQSAQIAFRVREPAASTVAFTFDFL
ncbi:DUF3426 domain-containing protein [Stenotrophomonas sp.]|uniref:DUF3426 domain-containing protein n=1 Tax=Stenotrophomonas sp. TaxID=69392 RepID=UPI0028AE67DC|nr:DUF3426 domain-containing protein [Stenotrophomonas sp.]